MGVIEIAKSGRATCRGCGEKILKDLHRFGEEVVNNFSEEGGTGYRWWHLQCAAKKVANDLRTTLKTFTEEVPDRAALDAIIAEHAHPDYPYAERAGNGRAKCRVCNVTLAKNELRVAFERIYETGMGVTKSAGYIHPKCTMKYEDAVTMGKEELCKQLKEHSLVSTGDLGAVISDLGEPSSVPEVAAEKTVTQA